MKVSLADGIAFEEAAKLSEGGMSMKTAKWIKEAAAIRETGKWLDGQRATEADCKDARNAEYLRA